MTTMTDVAIALNKSPFMVRVNEELGRVGGRKLEWTCATEPNRDHRALLSGDRDVVRSIFSAFPEDLQEFVTLPEDFESQDLAPYDVRRAPLRISQRADSETLSKFVEAAGNLNYDDFVASFLDRHLYDDTRRSVPESQAVTVMQSVGTVIGSYRGRDRLNAFMGAEAIAEVVDALERKSEKIRSDGTGASFSDVLALTLCIEDFRDLKEGFLKKVTYLSGRVPSAEEVSELISNYPTLEVLVAEQRVLEAKAPPKAPEAAGASASTVEEPVVTRHLHKGIISTGAAAEEEGPKKTADVVPPTTTPGRGGGQGGPS